MRRHRVDRRKGRIAGTFRYRCCIIWTDAAGCRYCGKFNDHHIAKTCFYQYLWDFSYQYPRAQDRALYDDAAAVAPAHVHCSDRYSAPLAEHNVPPCYVGAVVVVAVAVGDGVAAVVAAVADHVAAAVRLVACDDDVVVAAVVVVVVAAVVVAAVVVAKAIT